MLQITDQATTRLLRARTERGFDEQAGTLRAQFPRCRPDVFSPEAEPGDQVLACGVGEHPYPHPDVVGSCRSSRVGAP